jgi:hypothetical protein
VPSDPVFSAYPTPFEDATTLTFTLPAPAAVTLTVYDVLGRRMAVLVAGEQAPGAHRYAWDATDRAGGVYIARLEITDPTGTHAFTRLLTHR